MSQLNDFPQTPLEDLLMEVEQAWEQGRGYECASRLAEKHSNHADDLLDFLEGLLSIELGSTPDPEAAERSAANVVARLEAAGQHPLADTVRRSAGLPITMSGLTNRATPTNINGGILWIALLHGFGKTWKDSRKILSI